MAFDLEKLREQFTKQTVSNKGAGAGVGGTVSHERAYSVDLNRKYQKPVQIDIEDALFPVLSANEITFANAKFFLMNDKQNLISQVNAILNDIDLNWQTEAVQNAMLQTAEQVVETEDVFNRKRFIRNINTAVGVDITNILKDQGLEQQLLKDVNANFSLIKSMPVEQIDRIRKVAINGIVTGSDTHNLFQEIKDVGGVSDRRARLIARDQISKINNGLNRLRQKDIGLNQYVWRTSLDERVRPSHRSNNRKKFNWDSPPATGHPGDDVQCRCIADPYLADLRF